MRKLLCILSLLSLLSCSSDKTSELRETKMRDAADSAVSETAGTGILAPGSYYLEIKPVPSDATRKSTIYLSAQGFAPAEAKIEWRVNGEPVAGQSALQFKVDSTKKGDSIQAKVTIKGQEILSNIVQIKNSPPSVKKVRFVSEGLKPGDVLGVDTGAEDIDGDEVTFSCEWTKNGEPVGEGKSMTVSLKRGDKVIVKVTPFDGEAYGRPVTLEREINNMPPVIHEHTKFSFDGRRYAYQVNASDPDGDALTYSLKSGPSGMKIDPSTGLVEWTVPADFKGRVSFTVSVSDGQSGETSQNLSFQIKEVAK